MRKWLAGKLFDLALWLDWDETVVRSIAVLIVEARAMARLAPKPKRGRPLGSKNKSAPKKIGRPLGSKNKPKVQP